MTDVLVETIGWAGAALLLAAYALVSLEKLRGGGRTFQLMNLGGLATLASSGSKAAPAKLGE